MPRTDPQVPPEAFKEVCARWAYGKATSSDVAVLTALTTQTPLPPTYSTQPLGFDPTTRLPPALALPLFHAAKDVARATFHAETSARNAARLSNALRAPLPQNPPRFPDTLAAAPARTGLAAAATAAVGRALCATWAVDRASLAIAGPGFVGAARAAGWEVVSDVEAGQGVVETFRAEPSVSDRALVYTVGRLLRGVERDVVPAGRPGMSDVVRTAAARAGRVERVWLGVRLWTGRVSRCCMKRRRALQVRRKPIS